MRYGAILIDADDTLFDFHVAERNAISEVLKVLSIRDANAHQAYHEINKACWADFEQGVITQEMLKTRRFVELIARYSVDADAEQAANLFADALSKQSALIDGALDAVQQIAGKLPVAIVTNGIGKIQHGRMERSPLNALVSALIISEEVGCAKPDRRMIGAALKALGGIAPEKALMVGDSLTSDMQCAVNACVDACWYNPEHKKRPEGMAIQYEIDDLRQLPGIALQ